MTGLTIGITLGERGSISTILATHIYTGTLTTDSKLKDTGKQKQNLTINSGAMTLFNGVDQNISISQSISPSHTVSVFNDTIYYDGKYNFWFSDNIEWYNSSVKYKKEFLPTHNHISISFFSDSFDVYLDGTFYKKILTDGFHVKNSDITIGSRNSSYESGTANCALVIDGILTPDQVKYLHDYPHKAVAHYNVNDAYTTPSLPDVTASLNMPLTEVGKYKIDYSKAFVGELINSYYTSLFQSTHNINDVVVNNDTIVFNITSNTYTRAQQINQDLVVGKYYLVKFHSTSSGLIVYDGDGDSIYYRSHVGDNISIEYINPDSSGRLIFTSSVSGFQCTVSNISVREATAYEVAEHTTSCDLTQQEDGLQMIAFKQNNGILEKYMDNKMVGDGGVMVAPLALPTDPITNHTIPLDTIYDEISIDENIITYTEYTE